MGRGQTTKRLAPAALAAAATLIARLPVPAQAENVRVKELAQAQGVGDYEIQGMGLVLGLKGSADRGTLLTKSRSAILLRNA